MVRQRWGWGLFSLLLILGVPLQPAVQEQNTLLLTEVYYDTPGRDADEEWLEVANLGDNRIDLAGYKVGDAATVGSREGMLAFPEDAGLEPSQVVVVAQSASGFQARFGQLPDYEIQDSDPTIPDMHPFTIWGTGDFALNNEGDEVLLLDAENRPVDVVNYGDADSFFFPAVDDVVRGQSIARQPAGCDTNSAADWVPLSFPTPGTIILEGDCRPRPDPEIAGDILPIGAIQGAEDISPFINQIVTVRGIVTGFLADQNAEGVTFYTLFIQDEGDGDPHTSDGLAIFLATLSPTYRLGDELLITGRVTEFFGFTEIDHENIEVSRLSGHNPLPEAAVITDTSRLESLEGMRVTLPESPVIGPTHAGCGFAVFQGGNEEKSGEIYPHLFRRSATDLLPGIIPILHTSDVDCAGFPQLKVGDRVAGLEGPLIYHFDEYKIVHQDPAGMEVKPAQINLLPAVPTLQNTQFSVATFNLENHFDQERHGNEPVIPVAQVMDHELRLARTIYEALGCPTILGVQEVENRNLLISLSERLMEPCGFEYVVAHEDSPDARGIDVALMVNGGRGKVGPVTLEQLCTPLQTNINDPAVDCPAGQYPLHSRPPLRVALTIDNMPYTVFVNHFKSKREGEVETAQWRLAQARHQHELVLAEFAENPQARILVLGDFNDYEQSPPLLALIQPEGMLINPLRQLPDEERYSYNFGGAAQLIDGILISPSVAEQVAEVTILHVNADFPSGWALEHPDSLFRSSDHDIPLVILDRPVISATETVEPNPTWEPTPTMAVTGEPVGQEISVTATPMSVDSEGESNNAFPLWFIGLLGFVLFVIVGSVFYFRQR